MSSSRLTAMPWLLLFVLAMTGCEYGDRAQSGLTVSDLLGESGDADAYARALAPRAFSFPADHGPHPDFRNEWWYLTGHLEDDEGNRYGYQVTFFRIAVAPAPPATRSAWATNQLWMAHAALTDVAEGEHLARQRFARGALDLAGAEAEPVRVWLGDWRLENSSTGEWRLHVEAEGFAIGLKLDALKPVVLQGELGLSQKSAAPGNASYYYSQTRLKTGGTLMLAGRAVPVTGLSWLDREWGTSALGPDQVGWDWFSLQLQSGEELMFYRLRTGSGTMDPFSQGTWVAADGRSRRIAPDALALEPLEFWQSPAGRRYPVTWRLRYPGANADWEVRALLADQEMDLAVTYWEGLVEVVDRTNGRVIGQGYLEMTGY